MPPQQALFLAIAFSDRMATPYIEVIEQAIALGAELHGLSKEGSTPLTAAILDGMGSPKAVKKLLALGADATQIDNNGWSPWAACQSRKTDRVVADEMQQIEALLLASGLDPQQQHPAPEADSSTSITKETDPLPMTTESPSAHTFPAKYAELFELGTNGINDELETDDVVRKLMEWDERYGIELGEIKNDGLWVKFVKLPEEGDALDLLCKEIYQFCPDVIEQGFGCMKDMLEMMKEHGLEMDEKTQKLIAGINFKDKNYGMTLLARSLLVDQTLSLWWD